MLGSKTRNLLAAAVVVALIGFAAYDRLAAPQPEQVAADSSLDQNSGLSRAIATRGNGVHVEARGTITRVLPDDNNGSRHQRFIVRIASGQTVLIAHNIDVASRVTSPKVGTAVEFSGDYEWNERGGVVHWTHTDPSGKHQAGWVKYNGQLFQ